MSKKLIHPRQYLSDQIYRTLSNIHCADVFQENHEYIDPPSINIVMGAESIEDSIGGYIGDCGSNEGLSQLFNIEVSVKCVERPDIECDALCVEVTTRLKDDHFDYIEELGCCLLKKLTFQGSSVSIADHEMKVMTRILSFEAIYNDKVFLIDL